MTSVVVMRARTTITVELITVVLMTIVLMTVELMTAEFDDRDHGLTKSGLWTNYCIFI